MEEFLTLIAHVYGRDASKTEALIKHLASIQTFQDNDLATTWDFVNDLLARMDAEDKTQNAKPQGGSVT